MTKGIYMTAGQVRAHQERHGFVPPNKNAITTPLLSIPRSKMNKTETEFSRILESRKQRGEILSWVREGIRLRWGDCMHYKADFAVRSIKLVGDGSCEPEIKEEPITLIEVKGGHIRYQDLVRFRGCRAEWKKWFRFELWRKSAGQWQRLE